MFLYLGHRLYTGWVTIIIDWTHKAGESFDFNDNYVLARVFVEYKIDKSLALVSKELKAIALAWGYSWVQCFSYDLKARKKVLTQKNSKFLKDIMSTKNHGRNALWKKEIISLYKQETCCSNFEIPALMFSENAVIWTYLVLNDRVNCTRVILGW